MQKVRSARARHDVDRARDCFEESRALYGDAGEFSDEAGLGY